MEGSNMRILPVVTVLILTGSDARISAATEPKSEEWPEFRQRVDAYMKLHDDAKKSVKGIKHKTAPEKIQEHEAALAKIIRTARPNAKQGDIFGRPVAERFAALIKAETKGPAKKPAREALKESDPNLPRSTDAPKGQAVKLIVNATYPKDAPLSTVPPSLLLRLPKLPEALEYRFVGQTLILHDRDANIIVDYLPHAAPTL
jgi:hypothetical protein